VSDFDFVVSSERRHGSAGARDEQSSIHFGLGAIKGVGRKAVEAIVKERSEKGPFETIFEFCERVDLSVVNRATVEALVCAGAFDSTGAMRKALVEGLESAIAAGQSAQRDRKSGQMSLFGGAGAAEAPVSDRCILSSSEWTEAEMLAREKAVLGFYITRHPLASCETLLKTCATTTTAELARFGEGEEVVLGGMVSGMRTVVARGGRRPGRKLGIVTLEDLAGRVETIVFPDDLIKYQALLVPDAIVFIVGEVDRKREEPSVRVSKVVAQDQVIVELTRALLIDVGEDTPVDAIVELLKAHSGECVVYMSVETRGGLVAQIECNPQLRVRCDDTLLASLQEIVGNGAIHLVGPRRKFISGRRRQFASSSPAVAESRSRATAAPAQVN
jgi:DNA polymerase-3 subunit alpha